MPYYIDFTTITLSDYKKRLQTARLIPSQKILLDDIDTRFEKISKAGIKNMSELEKSLHSKKDVEKFADKTGIPMDYLTVMRREINSLLPEPRKIDEFTILTDATKQKLQEKGVKTTLDLYALVCDQKSRKSLAGETSITDEEALLLAKIVDLCRLRYVSPTFATVLILSGYDTAQKIQNADPREMYEKLTNVNAEKSIYKGKIGENDMAFLIYDAKTFPTAVEY